MDEEPHDPRWETTDEPAPSWVDVIDDILDEHVSRDEALELRAEDLTVDVPLSMRPDAEAARWRFNGTLRVSVEGAHGPLASWLRLWYSLRRQELRREGQGEHEHEQSAPADDD